MADPHTKAVAMSPQPDNAQTSATDSTPPPQEAPDPDSDDLDDLDGKTASQAPVTQSMNAM